MAKTKTIDWALAPAPESKDHVKINAQYELFINGMWVKPKSGKYFDTINSAPAPKRARVDNNRAPAQWAAMLVRAVVCLMVVGMPRYSFAQPNYGLLHNGASSHVDLGTDAASGVRSVELWFRPSIDILPTMTIGGAALLVRNDADQSNEFGFYFRGTEWSTGRGYLHFFMRDNGILHEIASDEYLWSANAWHHACATIDANEGMKLYVDGVLQTTSDPSSTVAIPSSGELTTIGAWGDALIRFFPGTIDEVRMWNRALNAAEVQANMCLSLELPVNGLIGYWRMDEGSGPTAFDATAGAHHGTINGATYQLVNNCVSYVGLDESPALSGFTITPHPCSGGCLFSFEQALSNATLTIFDASGSMVLQQQGLTGSSFRMPANGLSNGTYIVVITDADGGLPRHVPLVIASASRQ